MKPRVGEKGWGTGLMHTHQFLNSFFYVPWDKNACSLAHLGKSQHPTKSPSPLRIQLCRSGCLTGNLKPYQGQVLQGGSLVTSSNGCYRDYFPGLFAVSLLDCISVYTFALHALSGCHPFCAPGTLTPTFDQQCQPSQSQPNAPTPLICCRHSL